MMVMMTAITPSLNASSRLVPIRLGLLLEGELHDLHPGGPVPGKLPDLVPDPVADLRGVADPSPGHLPGPDHPALDRGEDEVSPLPARDIGAQHVTLGLGVEGDDRERVVDHPGRVGAGYRY